MIVAVLEDVLLICIVIDCDAVPTVDIIVEVLLLMGGFGSCNSISIRILVVMVVYTASGVLSPRVGGVFKLGKLRDDPREACRPDRAGGAGALCEG